MNLNKPSQPGALPMGVDKKCKRAYDMGTTGLTARISHNAIKHSFSVPLINPALWATVSGQRHGIGMLYISMEKTMGKPWFRFYSETLTDRKVQRICRATEQPKAVIIGAWTILLALSNDSPVPGILLLTEEISLTEQDIIAEMGLDEKIAHRILAEFTRFSMLAWDGRYYLLKNWSKRQFASDDVNERVKRYRAKKATAEKPSGNVTETLQDENCNAPEQTRPEHTTDQIIPDEDLPPKPAEPTPSQYLFRALADLCQISTDSKLITKKQRGQLNAESKRLRDADIDGLALEAFGRWWYAHDWRGKKKQPPDPSQVRSEWGKFQAAKRSNRAPTGKDFISGKFGDSIRR